ISHSVLELHRDLRYSSTLLRDRLPRPGPQPRDPSPHRRQPLMHRKIVFPNGLTILTEEMPNLRSVSLGAWLKQRSSREGPDGNGVSHFIEPLLFKGTERRSAADIARAIDAIGGQCDAFTSKEYTCFYARVLDDHLPVAVDLLSDIVLHPRFDPENIE